MKKSFFAALLGLLALCHFGASGHAQCIVQFEGATRQSADDLTVVVQGTCSNACQQITVHWNNPLLPDKTVSVTVNSDDPTQPSTWNAPYTSADGLTLSMLQNNFACGSDNFSLQTSCANVPNCQVSAPAGVQRLACKQQNAICTIQDTDLHCGENGKLTGETSVSSTGNETVSVTLDIARNGQNVASRSLSDNDGFVTVSKDFDFAAGAYALTTSVTAPASCVQTRTSTFSINENACVRGPPGTGGGNNDNNNNNNTSCPTCQLCGGDWTCCVAWAAVFIGLLFLIAAAMYLICDPSGGGGWGWLILAIAAIVFALALWWVIVHCRFDICRLLQTLIGAFTIDLTMVCAIEGLFPCFSALICGVTVIAGQAIRNWFLILLVGILLILGIQAVCPLLQ